MKNNVMLSVIVPVYNAEDFLTDLMQSLLEQSYRDRTEVILINDGSTDSSLSICNQFASSYEFVRVIDQINGGVSSARNAGLLAAKGEYITFADADDLISPEMYTTMMRIMENSKVEIVSCDFTRSLSAVSNKTTVPVLYSGTVDIIEAFLNEQLGGVGVWNKIFKKDVIKNEIFNTLYKFNEDKLFLFQACLNSRAVIHIPSHLYVYRENINSATQQPVSANLFDIETVTIEIEERLMENKAIEKRVIKLSSVVSLIRLYRTVLLSSNKADYASELNSLKEKILAYSGYSRYYGISLRAQLLLLRRSNLLYEILFLTFYRSKSLLRNLSERSLI